MIDMDEIRKEVAIKHNVLLDEKDPSLWTLTIFELLLFKSVSTLNEQHEANLKALVSSQQKSHEETRRLAKKVVDEGTEYACDQISTAITATMDEGKEQIRADLRLAWNKIDQAKKVAVFSAAVSVCALVAVLAMFNVA